eukprot:Amastigsp_a18180_3.p4 type:complete len:101 gc:universal Amastigsp_a18180_3:1-303(+)
MGPGGRVRGSAPRPLAADSCVAAAARHHGARRGGQAHDRVSALGNRTLRGLLILCRTTLLRVCAVRCSPRGAAEHARALLLPPAHDLVRRRVVALALQDL